MSERAASPLQRRRLSLTVRISALLIAAVILPLLITIIGSELVLRPTLTSQAITEMEQDATSHEQAIDSLLIAREQDLETLGQLYAVQQFLTGNPTTNPSFYKAQAKIELKLGVSLDPNYSDWTLFTTNGGPLLSYPNDNSVMRGKYAIPPEIMSQLKSPNKTVISDVYFDPNVNMAYIDIYTSITSPSSQKIVIGIARSTLTLNDIWTTVNNETNAATGSYAVILDGNGVRIAYTNIDTTLTTLPATLFKAVTPLSPEIQQQISSEDLYGNGKVNQSSSFDPTLANQEANPAQTSSYQFTPVEQTASFQAYQIHCQVVPWTYVILRPVNTITGAANQQDIYLLIIAIVVTLLAGIVGLLVGRSMTRPLLNSVSSLTQSSETLKVFSTREQARAKEQKWIVESAQTGLKSVQYYAKANTMAAQKLEEISHDFSNNWERFDNEKKHQYLREIISAADYIKKAASHEERSSRGLSTAIQVTNQVAEQLVSGAASASEAASQLEEVIAQLRRVVGE